MNNNQKTNDFVIHQRQTKHMFTRFADENYSFPLMISELIDNTIAAYEELNGNGFEETDYKKLDILIDIYHEENEANSWIVIHDNSAGMNIEKLKDSAYMYKKENNNNESKGNDDLNQYGIGLKSSVFWMGKDVWVYSKTRYCKNLNYWYLNTSDKNDEDKCEIICNFTNEFNSWDEFYISKKYTNIKFRNEEKFQGTYILVKNINRQREKFDYFYDENKKTFLQIFLGIKYRNYIKKGLRIHFNYRNSDKKSENETISFDVYSAEVRPFRLKDLDSFLSSKNNDESQENNKKIREKKETFINKINTILDFKLENEKDLVKKNIINNICQKILNDDEVVVGLNVKNINHDSKDKSLPINVGIISIAKNKLKLKFFDYNNNPVLELNKFYNAKEIKKWTPKQQLHGVNVYHHNRGIKIGPWLDGKGNKISGKMPEPVPFSKVKGKSEGKSTPLRMFGNLNIYGLRTEVNKAEIYSENWDNFISEINTIWKEYFMDILDCIVEFENKEEELNTKHYNEIHDYLESKTSEAFKNSEIGFEEVEKDGVKIQKQKWCFEFSYDNNSHTEKYCFTYNESNYLNGQAFIYDYYYDDDLETKFVDFDYDINHAMWNPLNKEEKIKDKKLFREFVIPFIVVLILSEIISEDKANKEQFDPIKVTEILVKITKLWKNKKEELEDE